MFFEGLVNLIECIDDISADPGKSEGPLVVFPG